MLIVKMTSLKLLKIFKPLQICLLYTSDAADE